MPLVRKGPMADHDKTHKLFFRHRRLRLFARHLLVANFRELLIANQLCVLLLAGRCRLDPCLNRANLPLRCGDVFLIVLGLNLFGLELRFQPLQVGVDLAGTVPRPCARSTLIEVVSSAFRPHYCRRDKSSSGRIRMRR